MKACLECDDKITGREDKKFCGDACRNAYNNKVNKDYNNVMRNINNRLRRNYRILSGINLNEKNIITQNRLIDLGFDFKYFTGMEDLENENPCFILYDRGYKRLDQKKILVFRHY